MLFIFGFFVNFNLKGNADDYAILENNFLRKLKFYEGRDLVFILKIIYNNIR